MWKCRDVAPPRLTELGMWNWECGNNHFLQSEIQGICAPDGVPYPALGRWFEHEVHGAQRSNPVIPTNPHPNPSPSGRGAFLHIFVFFSFLPVRSVSSIRDERSLGRARNAVEFGIGNAECGVRNWECGIGNAELGIWDAEFGIGNQDCTKLDRWCFFG